ncbi:Glycerol-3-phosphate O-acyltransferase [mine drainage metagenome]|uniref:Glycerol-3-phosphate O-acyltransferase n=1 Tax=mine drainage metagenome TaxID=410659 RepID=T0Y9G5_9ZZZZ
MSIYVGRAPNRESGWFRVLFSENWAVVGRFRRLLALLLNGRDTIVHFSPPVSLRKLLAEADGEAPPRLALKLSRVLRAHFRRVRAAVIGPDLSHRRTLVDALLASEPVRLAIVQSALKEKTSRASARGARAATRWKSPRTIRTRWCARPRSCFRASGTSCSTASPCTTSNRCARSRPATK